MPFYEYRCRLCGHEFEQLVLPGRTPGGCPNCESQDLERLLSLFAVNSEGIRKRHLQNARRQLAQDPNRRDKEIAEAEEEREHMAEDGLDLPPVNKDKKQE